MKILPVLQLIFFMGMMQLAKQVLPFAAYTFSAQSALAIAIACSGLLLILSGGALFRKYKTTLNPLRPEHASRLVVSGIYHYTRNPMYLGFLLLLTAWCLYTANWVNFLLLPAFVLSINIMTIKHEEQALIQKFGEQYKDYSQGTRRWL